MNATPPLGPAPSSSLTCALEIDTVSVSLTLALNIVERHSRSECIRIINGIAIHFRFNGETRDTAIQIADAFAEKASDRSCQVAKLVAAASCILASKLLDTKHLKMTSFLQIPSRFLISFECVILNTLWVDGIITTTPTAVAHTLLSAYLQNDFSATLFGLVIEFIGYFYEIEKSTTFASSSVALAGIVISEFIMKDKCMGSSASILASPSIIDDFGISRREAAACIECYEKKRGLYNNTSHSPVSVDRIADSQECIPSVLGKRTILDTVAPLFEDTDELTSPKTKKT